MLAQRTRCGAVQSAHGLGLGELSSVLFEAFSDVIVAFLSFDMVVGHIEELSNEEC